MIMTRVRMLAGLARPLAEVLVDRTARPRRRSAQSARSHHRQCGRSEGS